MNLMNDSRLRGLIERAQAQGFTLIERKNGGHYKLIPPNKKYPPITVSCTPSDSNFYWQLRRQLRRCGFIDDM